MTSSTIMRRGLVGALCAGSLACSDFLSVDSPDVIDASNVDPVADAVTLANSAQQN